MSSQSENLHNASNSQANTEMSEADAQAKDVDSSFDGLFFPGGGRRKVVESLDHFARYGSMLLFLQAKEGRGKTTVLQQFVFNIDGATQTVFLSGKQFEGLFDEIETRLGLNPSLHHDSKNSGEQKSKAEPSDAASEFQPELDIESAIPQETAADRLRKYCNELVGRGRSLLLVLDDAQPRHYKDLGEIMALADSTASNLKLVISGTPNDFEHIKALVEAKGVLLNSIDLPEFSAQEAAAYAVFRASAEGHAESPYSDLQLKAAWKRSEGDLNRFHQLLAEFPVEPPKNYGRALLPLPHILVSGLLLLVIGLLFWLRSDEPNEVKDVVPIVLERIEPKQQQADVSGSLAENSDEIEEVKNAKDIEDNIAETVETAETDLEEAAKAIDVQPEQTARAVLAAATKVDEEEAEKVSNKPAKPQQETRVEKPVPGQQPVASTRSPAPAASVESSPEPSSAPQPAGSQDQAVHKRLLAWPDTGYALQLFGTHNRARAEKLVKDYFGQADLLFYETRHDNKPWYVVINGPYSGSESARKGIEDLPDGLRGLRPWPRNVASIKRDIRRYHD